MATQKNIMFFLLGGELKNYICYTSSSIYFSSYTFEKKDIINAKLCKFWEYNSTGHCETHTHFLSTELSNHNSQTNYGILYSRKVEELTGLRRRVCNKKQRR